MRALCERRRLRSQLVCPRAQVGRAVCLPGGRYGDCRGERQGRYEKTARTSGTAPQHGVAP